MYARFIMVDPGMSACHVLNTANSCASVVLRSRRGGEPDGNTDIDTDIQTDTHVHTQIHIQFTHTLKHTHTRTKLRLKRVHVLHDNTRPRHSRSLTTLEDFTGART